jgi:hypothetical protein
VEAVSPAAAGDLEVRRALGDPAVFAQLYDQHAREILRFFARRTTSVDWAAELTAETFAEAFLSAGGYRPDRGPARAWLFGVARHVLARSLRRRRVEARARDRLGMERSRGTTTGWNRSSSSSISAPSGQVSTRRSLTCRRGSGMLFACAWARDCRSTSLPSGLAARAAPPACVSRAACGS